MYFICVVKINIEEMWLEDFNLGIGYLLYIIWLRLDRLAQGADLTWPEFELDGHSLIPSAGPLA